MYIYDIHVGYILHRIYLYNTYIRQHLGYTYTENNIYLSEIQINWASCILSGNPIPRTVPLF